VRSYHDVLVSVTQPVNPDLRVGQRVFIEGSGDGARVVPRQ
jgi:outer membrane lipoprotein SlyB